MTTQKYVVVVDDDPDDMEICEMARKEAIPEIEFVYMSETSSLIPFLKEAETAPLLIICDINLPGVDGLGLRKKMLDDADLRYKSTPFVYWATSASPDQVRKAFDNLTQGFFTKPSSVPALCELLKGLIYYWSASLHPKAL